MLGVDSRRTPVKNLFFLKIAALLWPRGSCNKKHYRLQRICAISALSLRPKWDEQNGN
jgi:hypothetical protein